jgi:hypothetical protein
MLNLSDKEKSIYNCYLKFSRKGQPFNPRKDFTDLDDNTIVSLKKIAIFLSRYPHIRMEDYFNAPTELHPDEKYPSLAFFTTLAATKNYTLFKKKQEDEDPEKQIDLIKESFRFIGMFCLENNIPLEKYLTHKTGYMLSWLNHYREHRINPYSLMEINGLYESLSTLPKDEVELFAKNLNENFVAYKNRYNSSQETKTLVKEATNKIKIFIKNNLQSSKKLLV